MTLLTWHDRCYNMHDALEAAHALSNGQKYHFATVLSHEVQVTSPSAELQAGAANARQALRCDYCMDNSSILVCAFCGCKVRFISLIQIDISAIASGLIPV